MGKSVSIRTGREMREDDGKPILAQMVAIIKKHAPFGWDEASPEAQQRAIDEIERFSEDHPVVMPFVVKQEQLEREKRRR